jgi:aminopeptidase N
MGLILLVPLVPGVMGGEREMARSRPVDPHSFAPPGGPRVERIDLELAVDFDAKTLGGTATLGINRDDPKAGDRLILDTRDLAVSGVEALDAKNEWSPTRFDLGAADPIRGRPLEIALPEGCRTVRVAYATSPSATALQWVEPAGTAGKSSPFLYSQSQAIHVRSWIPCQDSPGVRVTYSAAITVPEGLTAVMSAEPKGREGDTFKFALDLPIPPYLIALAVGAIETKTLGPRAAVWAEPSVVDAAASEFIDTERMIDAAQARFGPYRWGRYDILVLPPSFPFGGMENARLTFATPTVIAGDRSLVALIAHELAHSWSGNLVTCATWRDFWLNEGFTTYLERRIVEDLYGPDVAAMEWMLGRADLEEELAKFDERDQILAIDLKGRDPDAGMTRVPYEKGALFLRRLEDLFGRETFDAFLKGYFDEFAFKSLTTEEFEVYAKEKLFAAAPEEASKVDLAAWLHGPGLPPDAPKFRSGKFDAVAAATRGWVDGETAAKEIPFSSWSTLERVHFVQGLPEGLKPERLAELDQAFGLTGIGNAEVAVAWLSRAIRAGYEPAQGRVRSFLTTIGRRKYLMPLYEALSSTPEGKGRARAIYREARPGYHAIARESLDALLGEPGA